LVVKKKSLNKSEYYDKVYGKILNFLSYRDRSESEIKKALAKYSQKVPLAFGAVIQEEILEDLAERGFIGDSEFAQSYIRDVISSTNPVGKRYISDFLAKKGVSKDVIETALASEYSEELEQEALSRCLEKKMPLLRTQDVWSARKKLANYLLRRGFSPSLVYAAVDTKFKRD